MKRTGFTLMELLLVVAILAIVAAAAAPTFTGGAAEALAEARKSAFMSAYQNTNSGANIMISVAAAKGKSAFSKGANLDNTGIDDDHKLEFYVPTAARQFKNTNGVTFTMGCKISDTASSTVLIGYVKGETATTDTFNAIDTSVSGMAGTQKTTTDVLNKAWEDIEAVNN